MATRNSVGEAAFSSLTLAPDPARDSAAVEIARARGYGVQRARDGRWVAINPAGRAVLGSLSDDPVLALESAETLRVAAEAEDQRRSLVRLIAAYDRGTHFLRPREAPPGSGIKVWDVIIAGTATVAITGMTSVVAGMIKIEELQQQQEG